QEAGESIVERWLHKVGARIRANEPLVEINTDKAVVEVPSPANGLLQEILKQDNDAVQPDDVLGRIATDTAPATSPPERQERSGGGGVAAKAATTPTSAVGAKAYLLSPPVQQLVRLHEIDAAKIKGSARGGRITVDDIENYLTNRSAVPVESPSGSRKIPHSPMRRRIAQHMVQSALRTAPHVTVVCEADLSAVV